MAGTPQLAPGVVLVAVPGRGLAVRTAGGEFLRVDTGDTDPGALMALLSGREAGGGTDTARPAGGGADTARLTAAFEKAGYAEPVPAVRPGRLAGRTVLLLGDPALTGPLERFVRTEGGTARAAEAAGIAALSRGNGPRPAGPAAVVWCLGSPVPPGLWDEADRLPRHGVAWLRCHREGALVRLEPLADRAGDVTSAHVRLRRLAVTPAHPELSASWDGGGTPDTGPPVTGAAAALIAALLTADLLAWAAGGTGRGPLPVRRRLREIDLRDLSVTERPVLPVPEVAPLLPVPPDPAPGNDT
ncbi:hypothetical protein [Streptomyces sp. CAU 1734]|uniref:hypothetical protein n=1 Tax=Streptomyces sp. CAU 1734 TaxID=3140360 RepID=UPI003260877C